MYYYFNQLVNAFDDILPSTYFDCSMSLSEDYDDDLEPFYLTISAGGRDLVEVTFSNDNSRFVLSVFHDVIKQVLEYPIRYDPKPFVKRAMYIAYNVFLGRTINV